MSSNVEIDGGVFVVIMGRGGDIYTPPHPPQIYSHFKNLLTYRYLRAIIDTPYYYRNQQAAGKTKGGLMTIDSTNNTYSYPQDYDVLREAGVEFMNQHGLSSLKMSSASLRVYLERNPRNPQNIIVKKQVAIVSYGGKSLGLAIDVGEDKAYKTTLSAQRRIRDNIAAVKRRHRARHPEEARARARVYQRRWYQKNKARR